MCVLIQFTSLPTFVRATLSSGTRAMPGQWGKKLEYYYYHYSVANNIYALCTVSGLYILNSERSQEYI